MRDFGGVLDFGLGFIGFGGCFCCEKKKGRKTSADYADKRQALRDRAEGRQEENREWTLIIIIYP